MREHERGAFAAGRTLAERMAERPVLVTFNGKSFDWPLLETRYRMTRKIQPCQRRERIWIFCIRREICGACAWGRCGWRNWKSTCWAGIAART